MTKGHGGGQRDVARSAGGSSPLLHRRTGATEVFPFHRCSPSSLCCSPPPPQVSVTDHKVQEFRASNKKERRYSERRPERGQERNQSQARRTVLHHPRTPTTRPRFNRFTRGPAGEHRGELPRPQLRGRGGSVAKSLDLHPSLSDGLKGSGFPPCPSSTPAWTEVFI